MENLHIIDFKGTKDGLVIHIDEDASFDELMNALYDKFSLSNDFFKGAELAGVHGRVLSDNQKSILHRALSDRFGMVITEHSFVNMDNNSLKAQRTDANITSSESEKAGKNNIDPVFQLNHAMDEGPTKFLSGTLRSGHREHYAGHMVIMGDVNPGAEIFASGNILVLGNLRGVVHAGCEGNHNAWVMALKLQPTQLRIGALITRSPDDEEMAPTEPEIAYIKDKMIIIEPYK